MAPTIRPVERWETGAAEAAAVLGGRDAEPLRRGEEGLRIGLAVGVILSTDDDGEGVGKVERSKRAHDGFAR